MTTEETTTEQPATTTERTTMIDISGDGGVLKRILTPAPSREDPSLMKPKAYQEVVVHYTGTLTDGTKFDSSYDRMTPFSFQLGLSQVIKGWDVGVATMFMGEKAHFTIRSDYAYGKSGFPPKIPEEATLEFDIELLEFHDKKKEKNMLLPEEKLQEAMDASARGNDLFKRARVQEAIAEYKEAVDMFENFDSFPESIKPDCQPIQLHAHLNLANAFLKTSAYVDAKVHATKALSIDANNCKALYRRGVACMHLDDYTQAKKDLLSAAHIQPQNKDIRKQLDELSRLSKIDKERQKVAFNSLFKK